MQKQQARWSSLEGVTLALNLILGSFFVFTLVRSPGGELVLTVLVALVSFCCLASVGALLLRLRKAACWGVACAALALLALSIALAFVVVIGGNPLVLPSGVMIIMALAGFAGLLGWLAKMLKSAE
jgi:hypothetical protein